MPLHVYVTELDASKIRISLESTSSTPSQRVPGLIVLFPSEITQPDFLYDPLNWKALSATSTDLVVKMTSAETYRHKLLLQIQLATEEIHKLI